MTSKRLRDLITSDVQSTVLDCYSALTARTAELVGFPAVYLGAYPVAQMHYAIPNCGVITPTEVIDQAARIVEAISIPLVVDADGLGETVAEAYRTVRRYQHVGVAGVHVEDQVNPNHSPYANGLLSITEMQAKIDAAVSARTDDDFVIIARCDAMYPDAGGSADREGALEEAIARGRAYADAGADAFLCAPDDVPVATLAAEVPLPIINYGNPAPGASLSINTGWSVAMAARLYRETAQRIFEDGQLDPDLDFAVAWEAPLLRNVLYGNRAELIDQDDYDEVIKRWARATSRPLRDQSPTSSGVVRPSRSPAPDHALDREKAPLP